MAVLGLRFCARAFSSCGRWGPPFIMVRGPHYRGLLLRSTGSRRAGSVVVAHGPSRSMACGIFPDQGLNLCPLHWQADSQPLHHQGSPNSSFFWMWNIQNLYLEQGLANCDLQTVFLSLWIKFYWNRAMPICLLTVHGWFCAPNGRME